MERKDLIMRVVLSLALVAGLAAPPRAQAEASAFCGQTAAGDWAAQVDLLVGAWSIKHMAGWAEMGSMVLPFPADPQADEVFLSVIDGDMVLDHPEAQQPMVMRPVDEPRWTGSDKAKPAGGKDPLLKPDDAALAVAGCDQMELPRVIGHSSATVDGATMNFTMRLMLLDPSTLYGAFQAETVANGIPIIARRAVLLNRSNP